MALTQFSKANAGGNGFGCTHDCQAVAAVIAGGFTLCVSTNGSLATSMNGALMPFLSQELR